MELEKRLEEKIDYLNEMYEKYDKLNQQTKGQYSWRLAGIRDQITSLEELREDESLQTYWSICYEEDLRESKR